MINFIIKMVMGIAGLILIILSTDITNPMGWLIGCATIGLSSGMEND